MSALAFDPYSFDNETPPADNAGAAVANPASVPCAQCGAPSPAFALVINPDIWRCARCLPGDPNDEALEAAERAAIMGEAVGDPCAAIPHPMPPAWSDTTMSPSLGARCRLCAGASWWCERDQPKGWRCGQCHPGDHLPAHMVREVRT